MRADVTATFHGPKVGLFVDPGKEHAGRVEVVEIGIPRDAPRPDPSRADLAGRARARAAAAAIGHEVQVGRRRRRRRGARPHRRADDGGAGGDANRCGLRAGGRAGVHRAQLRPEAAGGDDARHCRGRRRALAGGRGRRCSSCARRRARSCSARGSAAPTVRSSGRARSPAARRCRVLIDADGLNAHAGRLESLRERPAPTVLTPHEGELGPAARASSRTRCRRRASTPRARPPSAAAASSS